MAVVLDLRGSERHFPVLVAQPLCTKPPLTTHESDGEAERGAGVARIAVSRGPEV